MRRALISAILCSSGLLAQTQTCSRTIPVEVLNEDGNPILGVTASDLSVKADGKTAEIVGMLQKENPRIVLILDRSSSMEVDAENKLAPFSWQLADDILHRIPRDTLLGVVVFDEKATVIKAEDWQSVYEQFLASLTPESKRKTALWDAIETAEKLFDPPQPGDSILVISDGGDNQSHHPEQERKRLQWSGIRLFGIVVTQWTYPTLGWMSLDRVQLPGAAPVQGRIDEIPMDEISGLKDFIETAEQTGGLMVAANRHRRSGGAVNSLFPIIEHYYLATLSTNTRSDKPWLQLKMTKSKGVLKNAQLVSRRQLLPCPAP